MLRTLELKSANMPHPAATEHYSFVCGTRTGGIRTGMCRSSPIVRGWWGVAEVTPGCPLPQAGVPMDHSRAGRDLLSSSRLAGRSTQSEAGSGQSHC